MKYFTKQSRFRSWINDFTSRLLICKKKILRWNACCWVRYSIQHRNFSFTRWYEKLIVQKAIWGVYHGGQISWPRLARILKLSFPYWVTFHSHIGFEVWAPAKRRACNSERLRLKWMFGGPSPFQFKAPRPWRRQRQTQTPIVTSCRLHEPFHFTRQTE